MAQTLVCLNSEQVVANVIALGEIKPDRIVVISTRDMEGQFHNLRACARMMGLGTPDKAVLVPPWDFVAISEILARELPGSAFPGEHVILNATGGTKPMAMVALDHFQKFPDFSAIYVDSRTGLLYRFSPPPATGRPLSFNPSIPLYMRAYGFSAEAPQPPSELQDVSVFLERELPHVHGLIAKLKEALKRGKSTELSIPGVYGLTPRSKWQLFLNKLADAGVLSSFAWSESSKVLTLRTAHPALTCQYFGQCGWLEHLVYTAAGRSCDEVHANVRVFRSDSPSEGAVAEYDVVARIGGTLVFFECKAGGEIYESAQLANLIQALESKARLTGGVFARSVIVLGNKFRNPSDFQKGRARLTGVDIVTYEELAVNLDKRLEEIFRPFCGAVWPGAPHRMQLPPTDPAPSHPARLH